MLARMWKTKPMTKPARVRGFHSPAETRSKTREFEDNSQAWVSEDPWKPIRIHNENCETKPIGRRIAWDDEDRFRGPRLRVHKHVRWSRWRPVGPHAYGSVS